MEVIFVSNSSPRLSYLENELFVKRNIPIRFSTAKDSKLSALNISDLLVEEVVSNQHKITLDSFEGVPCLSFNDCVCPLSTIFFNLSRYEEYLPFHEDEHGRFSALLSWNYKAGMLAFQWNERLLEVFLTKYFPTVCSQINVQHEITVIPTFDIDQTRAYLGKSRWRKWGSWCKDLLTNQSQRLMERKKVEKGDLNDPFDSFEAISQVAHHYPETRVYWLLAPWSKFDKNISWTSSETIRSMRTVQHAKLGIHPGYRSNVSDHLLTEEFRRFKELNSSSALRSRQHFLKLRFPQTYRRLIKYGIEEDATMGYADHFGFRAGTAHPFHWFDLSENKATELLIIPFFYMDGTFRQYLKQTVEEAILEMNGLSKEVKKYGGVACFIWHNESFAEPGEWKGWRQLFDATLNAFKA